MTVMIRIDKLHVEGQRGGGGGGALSPSTTTFVT